MNVKRSKAPKPSKEPWNGRLCWKIFDADGHVAGLLQPETAPRIGLRIIDAYLEAQGGY